MDVIRHGEAEIPRGAPRRLADSIGGFGNLKALQTPGGGIRGGQAYGATDDEGAKVVRDPVTVQNYFATLAALLGIDPALEVMSPVGRPIAVSENGRPIAGLIG